MPLALRRREVELLPKGHVKPLSVAATMSQDTTEMSDTEFEEDFSDIEEYSGRRSEESVGHVPASCLQELAYTLPVWKTEQLICVYI